MMFTIFIKPTNFCDNGCEFCYLSTSVRSQSKTMTKETLHKVAIFLQGLAAKHSSIRVVWHGGEPLSVPIDWYKDAKDIFDVYDFEYSESMQTSLPSCNDEIIGFIKQRLNGFVGVSPNYGKSTENEWLARIKTLRANGVISVPTIVITKELMQDPKTVLDWVKRCGFIFFRIERMNSVEGNVVDRPNNFGQSKYYIALFDEMMKRYLRGEKYFCNTVYAAINGVLNGSGGERWGGQCQSFLAVIEPNGDINTCPDRVDKEFPMGNVGDGVESFFTNKKRNKWVSHQMHGHRTERCMACDFLDFCGSACPITEHESSECAGYYQFLKYIEKKSNDDGFRSCMQNYCSDYVNILNGFASGN